MTTYHVEPRDDLIVHTHDMCPCTPTVTLVPQPDGTNGYIITHHSLDGRERNET